MLPIKRGGTDGNSSIKSATLRALYKRQLNKYLKDINHRLRPIDIQIKRSGD